MSSHEAARGPSLRNLHWRILLCAGVVLSALVVPVTADATLPAWLQHIVGASTVESALYRAMQLPAVQALYPRPPKEAATELSRLIATNPGNAELYQLRAQADEQALDEAARNPTGSFTSLTRPTPSPRGLSSPTSTSAAS